MCLHRTAASKAQDQASKRHGKKRLYVQDEAYMVIT